jgi:hypothetical protein
MPVFNKFLTPLKSFLFSEAHAERLGYMRFLLCGTLLYIALFRQFNMDQFSSLALIDKSQALGV